MTSWGEIWGSSRGPKPKGVQSERQCASVEFCTVNPVLGLVRGLREEEASEMPSSLYQIVDLHHFSCSRIYFFSVSIKKNYSPRDLWPL